MDAIDKKMEIIDMETEFRMPMVPYHIPSAKDRPNRRIAVRGGLWGPKCAFSRQWK